MEYSKFNPGLSPRAVICSWRPNLPHQSEIVLVLHYWFNPFPKVGKAPEYIKRFSVNISNAAFAVSEACKLNDIYTVQCREYPYVFCCDTDTAVSLLCLFIYLCANSRIHTIYVCVYIYFYKKVCIHTQSPMGLLDSLSLPNTFVYFQYKCSESGRTSRIVERFPRFCCQRVQCYTKAK